MAIFTLDQSRDWHFYRPRPNKEQAVHKSQASYSECIRFRIGNGEGQSVKTGQPGCLKEQGLTHQRKTAAHPQGRSQRDKIQLPAHLGALSAQMAFLLYSKRLRHQSTSALGSPSLHACPFLVAVAAKNMDMAIWLHGDKLMILQLTMPARTTQQRTDLNTTDTRQ